MFDFRYHVVSLVAVFIALVLGVLVGIGLSGRGFVDDVEREKLTEQINTLRNDLARARSTADGALARLLDMQDLADEVYGPTVRERLKGKQIAVLFIGNVGEPNRAVERAVEEDAGGIIGRLRALRVPVDPSALQRAVAGKPVLRQYVGGDKLDEIARDLVAELVAGGRTPLWGALTGTMVEEMHGSFGKPASGVVVVRSAKPQRGATKTFLAALYDALAGAGVPAVGVQEAGAAGNAIAVFAEAGLSTVDNVDTAAGKLALVLLLSGARPGNYGVDEDASDGIVPPFDRVRK